MYKKLKEKFESLSPLSTEEWNYISSLFNEVKFDKGVYITKEGQIEKWLYFTFKGGTRVFYLKNGEEHCVDFEFENEFTGDYISFLQQKPSRFYVQTLEPTIFYAISHKSLQKLYTKYKVAEKLGRLSAENLLIKFKKRQSDLMIDNATERFINLMNNNKEWIQRVPQKYLASFLNITPEYYSRLKKNIELI